MISSFNIGCFFRIGVVFSFLMVFLDTDVGKAANTKRRITSTRRSNEPIPAGFHFSLFQRHSTEEPELDEDTLDARIARVKKELAIQTAENERIEQLFMLGRLSYEKFRILHYREMQAYDADVEKWMQANKPISATLEPALNDQRSRRLIQQAVAAFKTLVDQHKSYAHRAEVLFHLGYLLMLDNQKKDAIFYFNRLVKSYPYSQFAYMAHLALGEHYFDTGNYPSAKKSYSQAAKASDISIEAFSHYKLAWSYQRLGKLHSAADFFRKLLEYNSSELTNGIQNFQGKSSLRLRAIKEMIWLIAQIDQTDAFEKYFASGLKPGESKQVLWALSDAYIQRNQDIQAIEILRRLINDLPDDPDCPRAHVQILTLYKNLGKTEQMMREINRMVEQYQPGSRWSQINQDTKPGGIQSGMLLERVLRNLGEKMHHEAMRNRTWNSMDLARRILDKYLIAFEDGQGADRLRRKLVELQYMMRDYWGSGNLAEEIVKRSRPGASVSDMAYHAAVCWSKCIELRDMRDVDCRYHNPGRKTEALDPESAQVVSMTKYTQPPKKEIDTGQFDSKILHEFEKKFLNAAKRYLRFATRKQKALDIHYYAALILLHHRFYKTAGDFAIEMAEKHPKNQRTLDVVSSVLQGMQTRISAQTLGDKKAWQGWKTLYQWIKKLSENGAFLHSPPVKAARFDVALRTKLENARLELLMVERVSNPIRAAKGLMSFGKKHAASEFAPRALYESLVIFERQGMLSRAIEAGEELLSRHSGSELRGSAGMMLAETYMQIGGFSKAALNLEKVFEFFLSQPQRKIQTNFAIISIQEGKQALFKAAELRLITEDFSRALVDYSRFVKLFADDHKSIDCLFRMAEINEKKGQWRRAERFYHGVLLRYREEINAAKALFATYKRGLMFHKLGELQKSLMYLNETVEAYERLLGGERDKTARYAAAHAGFLLLEPQTAEYHDIELDSKDPELRKTMVRKMTLRKELELQYNKIEAYKSDRWTIASKVRIGQLAQDLSLRLYAQGAPDELDAVAKKAYKKELERQALLVEEDSISALTQAIDMAFDKGIYDHWVLDAQHALRRFRPDVYPVTVESRLFGAAFMKIKGPDLDFREVESSYSVD